MVDFSLSHYPFTTFPLPFHNLLLPTTQLSPSHYPFTIFPLPFHLLPTTPSPHSHSPFYTYPCAYPFSLSPLGVKGVNLIHLMRYLMIFYNTSQCMRHLLWSHDTYQTVYQPYAK